MTQSNESDKEISKWIFIIGSLVTVIGVFFTVKIPSFINEFLSYILSPGVEFYVLLLVIVLLLAKLIFIDKTIKTNYNLYFFGKITDIFAAVYIYQAADRSPYILILLTALLIFFSGLMFDSRLVKGTVVLTIVAITELYIIKIFSGKSEFSLIPATTAFIFNAAFCIISSKVICGILLERENEFIQKEKIIDELIENSKVLTNNNAEIKCKLNDLQIKAEKANKSLAELSTLKQVSQFVNSTLNIKELFDLVNDIVIGILGVTYCTIFMKTDASGKIEVQKSNIEDKLYLDVLKEKVALKIFNLAEQGQRIFANNIDPFTYPNGIERGIQSAIFVPIANKGRLFGLILAEHTMVKDVDNQTKFIEAVANQIGLAIENAMLYNEMQRLATTDALTKVYNRMYFQKYYTEEFKKAQDKYPICAVMLDIDFFKRFNDTYGHDFGDEVLKNTAQLVKKNLNSFGMLARYGGEEFVIILKNTPLDEGYKIADNLRKLIESNKIEYNGQAVNVTVSMGVSEYPQTAKSDKELLKAADEALYKAKAEGRNCVRKAI